MVAALGLICFGKVVRSEQRQTLKVLQITPSFYPARVYGGPIESVYQLCCHLSREGCEVRVLTTDANGLSAVLNVVKGREIEIGEGLRVRYCRRLIRHSVSPTLLRFLPSYLKWADVVHLTAVYSFPTIPTLLACKILDKPVIWSPRGALQRWKGSTRVQIKSVWESVCRIIIPQKLVLHVTSQEEAGESLEKFPKLKTCIIPNGVTIPVEVTHHISNGSLRLLYLGRLHPIKGIENLLEACKIFSSDPEMVWSLTIAGAGDPIYSEHIRIKIKEWALSENVKMIGEVKGDSKQKVFENMDVVIVPSYAENFGMVVAEALAHGVPVIASKGTPWKRLEEIGCGFWVDNDPRSLVEAIERISKLPLRDMGQRGREWIEREFDWPIVTEKMIRLYQSLMVDSQ